jgi:hypothetical protein
MKFITQYYRSLLFLFLVFGSSAFGQADDQKIRAQGFVQSREVQLQNKTDFAKVSDLKLLVSAAFDAGDMDKAERFAKDLLVTAEKLDKRFHANSAKDATHISNTILGLIAFEKGNVDEAKKFLLASSKVIDGSHVLKSFGPEMLLAKKLIEKNERETVIHYLDNCSAFWKMDRGQLEKWKSVINEGGIPDFGGQLIVQLANWKYD